MYQCDYKFINALFQTSITFLKILFLQSDFFSKMGG